ncbi:soluble quino protein glucose/sorbosone dehydrogenase [Biscogniauxia sp. FL1348]|nr:soluble quino protein glucose/sorbosone dehydrogenase [Biscogniauxia sp. FL1348]
MALVGVVLLAFLAVLFQAIAQTVPSSCPDVPPPLYPYSLRPGWSAVKVAGGLTSPRDLVIDPRGRLLVVQEGVGVSKHTVDVDGCITASQPLISKSELNHGISLSPDGRTLSASSSSSVFSWAYDPDTGSVSETPVTLVTGMAPNGHATRTLIVPPHEPDLLVVSHGSNSNLDYQSIDPTVARAIVKVFNISSVPDGGYDFATMGWNAGFGLRNDVALAFDGNHMLWSVENSADSLTRSVQDTTTDIHQDNPAEELNYLGDVTSPNDKWYGYPSCFTVWHPDAILDRTFQIGDQFTPAPNDTYNDDVCARASVPPRLSLQAHSAPLGSKFDATISNLFVTFHGSWNRQPPTGYKLIAIPFTKEPDSSYAPVANASDGAGYVDIFYPPDEGACSSSSCVRPVGLVFDAAGRLYMTSDTSGEVFLLSAH